MKFKFDILFEEAMDYFVTTNPYYMSPGKIRKMDEINTLILGRFKYFKQFMQTSWLKEKVNKINQPEIKWKFFSPVNQPVKIEDNIIILNKEFLSIYDLIIQLNDIAIEAIAQYIAQNLFDVYDRKYQKIYPLILKFLQDPTSQQQEFAEAKKQLLSFNKHNNPLYMVFEEEQKISK